ncbi:hypothetical protein AB0I10_38805 [Streptomyces sp. NPDC050636]|uniref:hypothetical protein n=1 Tax=Streptomyces sp. NPDC050636 TaxID=3154510 RepID=UPI0034256280
MDRTQIESDEQERWCTRHERKLHADGGCCQEVDASLSVYGALKRFTDLDSCAPEDTQAVIKTIDAYANVIASLTDGTTGDLVTGKDIEDLLDQHGHPCILRAEKEQLLADLERATEEFIKAVNAWQDRPAVLRRKATG